MAYDKHIIAAQNSFFNMTKEIIECQIDSFYNSVNVTQDITELCVP